MKMKPEAKFLRVGELLYCLGLIQSFIEQLFAESLYEWIQQTKSPCISGAHIIIRTNIHA